MNSRCTWLLPMIVASVACGGIASRSDGGDGNDAGTVDTGIQVAFSPEEIFGADLALWLDANKPDSVMLNADGGVVRWNSRVYNGSVETAFPLLSANGIVVDPAAANGKPGIRVGPTRGMLVSAKKATVAGEMVVSVVAAYNNPSSKPGWLFLMPAPNAYLAGNSKGRSVVAAGLGTGSVSSTTEGWNDGALHVFTLCSPEGLRVDGQQWSNWGPDPFGQDVIMIGGKMVPGPDGGPAPIDGPLDGYVAEVIMAKYASCTPTVVAQLNAYFQAKYGVPF